MRNQPPQPGTPARTADGAAGGQTASTGRPAGGVAFLLAQLGAHGAARFAHRLGALGLKPAHAGILRLIATEPSLNQRELASRLQALPSRVVALVDELETRGMLTRQRRPADRRAHTLQLTDAGRDALTSLRQIATAHEAEITATLTHQEHEQLAHLLARLADANGLTPGVHPGYRQDSKAKPQPT